VREGRNGRWQSPSWYGKRLAIMTC
jgi:hypothetical protein